MVCTLKRTDTKGTFSIFPRVLIIKEAGGSIIVIIICKQSAGVRAKCHV